MNVWIVNNDSANVKITEIILITMDVFFYSSNLSGDLFATMSKNKNENENVMKIIQEMANFNFL